MGCSISVVDLWYINELLEKDISEVHIVKDLKKCLKMMKREADSTVLVLEDIPLCDTEDNLADDYIVTL